MNHFETAFPALLEDGIRVLIYAGDQVNLILLTLTRLTHFTLGLYL